jgi:hypothetical protein
MRKLLISLLIFLLPGIAFAQLNTTQGGTGTTSPSGILFGNGTLHLQTVAIGSNLTFLSGILSATGGSAGAAYPFTPTTYNGNQVSATTTGIFANVALPAYGFIASSTFFTFSSTTDISVSSNSQLGTVTSGTWNGSLISTQYGGTGLSNPGSLSVDAILRFNGSGGASAISPGATGAVITSSDGSTWSSGPVNFASAGAITGILQLANGGTGGQAAPFKFNSLNTFSTTTFSTSTSFWTQGVFFSSSTVAASQFPYASTTALSSSNLVSGNCVQASTGGLLTTTGSACGAGGGTGIQDPFTHTSVFNQTTSATTTLLALTGSPVSLAASSTSYFDAINVSSTTATSTFNEAVNFGATNGDHQITITPSRNYGTSFSTGGAFRFDNTSNTGTGVNIYSNQSAPAGSAVLINVNDANSSNGNDAIDVSKNGAGLGMLINCSNSGTCPDLNLQTSGTTGSTYNAQMLAPTAPNIQWGQTNNTAPVGRWETGVDPSDKFFITGRDAANSTYSNLADFFITPARNGAQVSIGSSTPWATLSVQATSTILNIVSSTSPAFLVASTTAAPEFIVAWNGDIGIATSAPGTDLSIGNTGANTVNIDDAATSSFGSGINIATGCFAIGGVCVGGTYPFTTAKTYSTTTMSTSTSIWTQGVFFSSSTAATSTFDGGVVVNAVNGIFGVGTTSPTLAFSVAGKSFFGSPVGINCTPNQGGFGGSGIMTVCGDGSNSAVQEYIRPITSGASGIFTLTFGDTSNSVLGQINAKTDTSGSTGLWNFLTSNGTSDIPAVTINSQQQVGIGTTTPWGLLSMNVNTPGNSAPFFTIASSTPTATTTVFQILGNSTGAIFSVGSTTPWAKLSIHANNGDSLPMLFMIASSTQSATSTLFGITNTGHILMNTPTTGDTTIKPVVNACGTSPSISATSTDARGAVTTGTGSPTTCFMQFARAYSDTPTCVESDNSTAATADIIAASTTGVEFGLSAGLSTLTISYICLQ